MPKLAPCVLVFLVALSGCGRGEAPARGDAAGEARAVAPAPGATPAPVATPAQAPLAGPGRSMVGFEAALGAGIRRRDEGGFEVDSFVAATILEELTAGAGPTVAAHAGEGGGVDGFEIRGVADGSVYARLGLVDGDVVASVNGVALTSPGRAIAALSSVRRRVVVEVVRGGVSTSFEVRLIDGLAWSQTLAERGSVAEPEPVVAVAPPAVVPVDEAMLDGAPAAVDSPGRSGGTPTPARGGGKSGGGGGSKSGSSGGGASKSGGSGSAPTTTATCSSATSCTIRRSEVTSLLDSPERAMTQARVVPDLAGGEVRGYKLFGVRKGTTVDGLGFRNGDVIRSVNGYDLGDDGDALGLYMSLPGASSFRVNYVRGGLASIKVIKVI